ncbi:MAG: type II secretion system protein [Gammaproteobacteria bacterium]|nr:MAG: type II secretion system protein [Gammaproteobacteria bacterium]
MRARGFTLVELVLVIILLGILSVYAAARFSAGGYALRAAAQELVEAVRFAQQRSMSNSGAARYAISIQPGGFRVTQGGADVPNPMTGQSPYTDDGWAGKGISTNAGITLEFDARGEPFDAATGNSPGVVDVTLSKGSETALVRIQPITGYARVQ